LLIRSPLEKGREFHVQKATCDENGKRLIADVVICYPDGRKVIIDSKVSLNAYIDIVNCDNPNDLKVHQKKHIQSIRNHINELKTKKYQDYIGTDKAEFIMMFIPNEAAYSAAMTLEPTLWQKAYDKRVLLVSPTQLVGSLRLINQLWTQDRQTRNAIEIAEKSGQMYDKFVGFVSDMEKISKSIAATQTAYDNAISKLRDGRGNLINRAESLRKLGIKASKRLSQNTVTQLSEAEDDDFQPEE
jgi:DNA recombination protein RmuC